MQCGSQRYRSMVGNEGAATSFEGGVLFETLDLVAGVPNISVPEHCTYRGQMLDARRFPEMFPDGLRKTRADRRGMRHDRDIGVWERRLSSGRQ